MAETRPLAIVIQASPERIGGCRSLPETSSEWHIASLNECKYHPYRIYCVTIGINYLFAIKIGLAELKLSREVFNPTRCPLARRLGLIDVGIYLLSHSIL